MANQQRKYQTQWASQFYAAAELTRRGHLVALTLGNAQEADLLVVSPIKKQKYRVDVKGQISHNFWLVQRHQPQPDLYYILVFMSTNIACPPDYFILTSAEMTAEMDTLKQKALSLGKVWTEKGEGINWGQSVPFRNRWNVLPE